MKNKNFIITDVGSTTTKAVLLSNQNNSWEVIAVANHGTTVEKPQEDVKIGVFEVLKNLQEKVDFEILDSSSSPDHLKFPQDIKYLTTSSAGGGLQILVIGLTVYDSASSAKRAAYGAGGVILDTFAIDDKRSTIEQMEAMQELHPDIILFSGGIDGGAISSLVRLGEILSQSHPKPKFGKNNKIPLIFAGNNEAIPFVESMFSKQFDLYVTENIRPALKEENLLPARRKIHDLFMDKVMEQAPGYSELKYIVSDPIIPTPLGVIKSLQIVSEDLNQNVMAVDIGGATTDVFSNILGCYYRTVSANYGMSYSIANVLKESSFENIKKWLPQEFDEDLIRNYIHNKMLYPTNNPTNKTQELIEHAVAIEALSLSKINHMKMHFNTEKIGFLDRIKNQDLDKFVEILYVEKKTEERRFHNKDINIMIGAGGVISNTSSKEHAIRIIMEGLKPEGISEIWRDKQFITPHLGKLSEFDPDVASDLLKNKCFEKLAVIIRPIFKKMKINQKVMNVKLSDSKNNKEFDIKSEEFLYIKNPENRNIALEIELEKDFRLQNGDTSIKYQTSLPIIIDTRINPESKSQKVLELLGISNDEHEKNSVNIGNTQVTQADESKKGVVKIELPYNGKIFAKVGDSVEPETKIGENEFAPPRLYIISLMKFVEFKLTKEIIKEKLLIKKGDVVKNQQKILEVKGDSLLEELSGFHKIVNSPVRGIVEEVNYDTGIIVLREIQDYTSKPVVVKVAEGICVKPKHMKGYLKKKLNMFVHTGELLASRIDKNGSFLLQSPTTGTITNIDNDKGRITIQYKQNPFIKKANIFGKVVEVEENLSATIEYQGVEVNGIIGFGEEAHGQIMFVDNYKSLEKININGKILVCGKQVNVEFLNSIRNSDVKGVIAPSINNKDLVLFTGEEIGVALTGNENIPYPLILTEGFGDIPMKKEMIDLFRKSENKHCYISGFTQIRAGVVRPRVVIQ